MSALDGRGDVYKSTTVRRCSICPKIEYLHGNVRLRLGSPLLCLNMNYLRLRVKRVPAMIFSLTSLT